MAPMYDKLIRTTLISKLENQAVKPKAVIEELRVHNGNAIADVVALYKDAHCFEIKGDADKIERAVKQGRYYNLSFRRITLVTTTRHLDKAIELLPKFWGIMIAERKDGRVILKYIRGAKNNSGFDKSLALLILWKAEMLTLIEQHDRSIKKSSRRLLAQLISRTKKKVELSNNISTALIARHYQTSS